MSAPERRTVGSSPTSAAPSEVPQPTCYWKASEAGNLAKTAPEAGEIFLAFQLSEVDKKRQEDEDNWMCSEMQI